MIEIKYFCQEYGMENVFRLSNFTPDGEFDVMNVNERFREFFKTLNPSEKAYIISCLKNAQMEYRSDIEVFLKNPT